MMNFQNKRVMKKMRKQEEEKRQDRALKKEIMDQEMKKIEK